jgi:hypothetical protein
MHMAVKIFEGGPVRRRLGPVPGRILSQGALAAVLAAGALHTHAQIQPNGTATSQSLTEYARVAAKPADSWGSIDLHRYVVYFTGGPDATEHYRFLTEHAQELANSGITTALLQDVETGSNREQPLKELEDSLRKAGIHVKRVPPPNSLADNNANIDLIMNEVVATSGRRVLFVGGPHGGFDPYSVSPFIQQEDDEEQDMRRGGSAQLIRVVTPSDPLSGPIMKGIGKDNGNFILPLVQEQKFSRNGQSWVAAAKYSQLFAQTESEQAKKARSGVYIPGVWDSRKDLTPVLYETEPR